MNLTRQSEDIFCTQNHEYIILEDNKAKIGLTDYIISQYGDIIAVELPDIDSTLLKDEPFGTIECVKGIFEIYMPIDGQIAEINETLITQPELLNEDCYGKGWMISVENFDKDSLNAAMALDEYREYTEEL